jgi:hypothetical protein
VQGELFVVVSFGFAVCALCLSMVLHRAVALA